MNNPPPPIVSDLLLLGGGHANVQVLKMFSMKPIGGLRITLISDQTHSPYSGMIPGFLAGYYTYEDCHFDMRRMCEEHGHRFIQAKIIGIDTDKKLVQLENRVDVHYACASLNVGIVPKAIEVFAPDATFKAIPLKPISQFIGQWTQLLEDLRNHSGSECLSIAVIGAGAAGVEIAIILKLLIDQNRWNARVCLIQRHDFLVSAQDHQAQQHLQQTFQELNIAIYANTEVLQIHETGLLLKSGESSSRSENFFRALIATQAAAPGWFKDSQLPINEQGFVKVDAQLRVENQNDLFAAGDCIHFSPSPLKKAGVYAVREGRILGHNIRAFFTHNVPLKTFVPKRHVLSLITVGERKALVHQDDASILRCLSSSTLWIVKDWIDRDFMRRFQAKNYAFNPGPIRKTMPVAKATLQAEHWHANTCGGCGSKIAAATLAESLSQLAIPKAPGVLLGVQEGEDCALVEITKPGLHLHSLDQFRSFISDPYLFGQIATQHALSDLYAMGGQPTAAQVGITLEPATPTIQKEELYQLMSGILDVLAKNAAVLLGGHTGEGAELSIALAVQGIVKPQQLLKKNLTRAGDRLILTKAIGTGVILAANMLAQSNGKLVDQAIRSMLASNGSALNVMRGFAVSGCTDVTGFGLLGHALEMLRTNPHGFGLKIDYSKIPTFTGVTELFAKGYQASLAPSNYHSSKALLSPEINDLSHPLLFDPQTSGGLLFAVPSEQAEECVAQLHSQGITDAAIIGEVTNEAKLVIH